MINGVTGSPYLLEAFVFLRFCPAVHGPRLIHYPCHPQTIFSLHLVLNILDTSIKGVVNCQNSRDKGPPEGNSARG